MEYIKRVIGNCKVVLVVIDPEWINVKDVDGNRRLDNPDDAVRLELTTALSQSNVRVIPLLVDGAAFPSVAELPGTIESLVLRQGVQIRADPDFHLDMNRLITTLKENVDTKKGSIRSLLGTINKSIDTTDQVVSHISNTKDQIYNSFIGDSRVTASQRAKIASKGRIYENLPSDLNVLAVELNRWFCSKKYEVLVQRQDDAIVIEAHKKGYIRTIFGLDFAALVVLSPSRMGARVAVGGARWLGKATIAFIIAAITTAGLAVFIAGFIIVRQKLLQRSIKNYIDKLERSKVYLDANS